MGAFEYKALDQRGRTRRGVASGDTARQVRQTLREQGLSPLSVATVREEGGGRDRSRPSQARLGDTQLAVITRQFATLVGSGMTVEAALTALIAQSEGHQVKSVLSSVRAMVMEGRSLADALKAFPRSFPEIFTASVAAGEQTGRLAEVLDRLADFTESRQGLKQRIGVALVYPAILTVVAVLIVVALLTYVVPQVVRVFEDAGQQLPLLTRILIGISDVLHAWGLWMVAALFGAALFLSLMLRRPGPKSVFHRMLLAAPGTRRLSRGINSARLARTLAIMVGSGVPLLSSMRATAEVVGNRVMRAAFEKAADEVREGGNLSRALGRSGYYPPLLTQMIASGEQSGSLDSMLDKSATALEREIEARIAVLVGLFEPIMILVMGGIVLTIVLAILLPIFDLNQLIR